MCHYWSEHNPKMFEKAFMHPSRLIFWCDLRNGGIIAPYFFRDEEGDTVTVNGLQYKAMLTYGQSSITSIYLSCHSNKMALHTTPTTWRSRFWRKNLATGFFRSELSHRCCFIEISSPIVLIWSPSKYTQMPFNDIYLALQKFYREGKTLYYTIPSLDNHKHPWLWTGFQSRHSAKITKPTSQRPRPSGVLLALILRASIYGP